MSQECNENGPTDKDFGCLINGLFSYLRTEFGMRKRIAGETGQYCLYEGTYYYEQDHSQTKYLMQKATFPPVLIRSPEGKHGGNRIGPGIWVLREEDSPRKGWRDFGHVYRTLFFLFIFLVLLYLALNLFASFF